MYIYLQETAMLNYNHADIQTLIHNRKWLQSKEKERIASIYNFVRDEIKFGYNIEDTITATKVLLDGFGQCNTKATLFMALLRATHTPCRLHGFMIDKKVQKGTQTGLVYLLAPKEIVHSWVEVFYKGTWWDTEGLILDIDYLRAIQKKFSTYNERFCGYGIATENLQKPIIDWNKTDTYIQDQGIVQDLGTFVSPDDFFCMYRQKLSLLKKWLYRNWGRKSINKNILKLRDT